MSAPANSVPGERKPFGGRWAYAVLIVALLFVLMPFLFWRATWFGRPLTDAQLQKALADSQHPREIQHALSQIADRILRGDPTVQRWYPDVVRLAANNADQIRLTAAWVMGQDNSVPAFHEALLKLLADSQPMVARNAALSLVRFHDTAGRSIIVSMLRPYAMSVPDAGVLKERLKPGDVVNTDTLVAHVWVTRQKREVRSVVPGTIDRWLVPDGASVSAGQPILALAPSEDMVWEALRALYLIGLPEDLPDVDRYARGVEGMSRRIQQQAIETSRAIRSRQP
jgi:Biotin-requiring enzyme